jgi:hypothetical protein
MRFTILLTLAVISLSFVSCAPVTRTTSPAPGAPSSTPSFITPADVGLTPEVSEIPESRELEENVDECSICPFVLRKV